MQPTEEVRREIGALDWALRLLKKFPIETAIAEIKKYKEELESEM